MNDQKFELWEKKWIAFGLSKSDAKKNADCLRLLYDGLIKDGATQERAENATLSIGLRCHEYKLATESVRTLKERGALLPPAETKRELLTAASRAEALLKAVGKLSAGAQRQIARALAPSSDHKGRSAAYELFENDVGATVKVITEAASSMHTQMGRAKNRRARVLGKLCVVAWCDAAGQPPSLAKVEGVHTSPLYKALDRLMSGAVTKDLFEEIVADVKQRYATSPRESDRAIAKRRRGKARPG
jgi:hypothetical protein